ncbi:MAG: leucyl aminopeptidase [Piscinibacter sp.]|uniref:leucyl aminopeptidase n=1 Tax=Piscinibacter TaxID=1114981 RepID=UPI000FDF52CC|nr:MULTISPECIES: leucyl aminopeptidase [Piscinibacter]MCW5664200.1 leucyl aminopeptidase [Piscinibacter sp.]
MEFRHQIAPLDTLANVGCDALLVIVAGEQADAALDAPLAAALADALAQGDFELKAGKTVYLHRPAGVKAARVVFAAAGAASAKAIKAALAAGLGLVKAGGAKHLAVAFSGAGALDAAPAEALVAAVHDAVYVYRHTKPSAPKAPALAKVSLLCGKAEAKAVAQGLARGEAIAAGVALARECANRPGNHCTPTWLGEQAKKLGKEFGLKVEVLDRKAIEKLGMGSFLAVAQGSDEPPRFIVAQYHGAPKTQAPVVLVGKGITFDTGGISIKPAAEMDEMKFDMGGAAGVLGTLRAIAQLKPKLNLVVLVPTCENMPGGRAVKPGDVVTSLSGQTIEILNTDAEGRLILCDALTYAERFKPAAVVDVATLTGACVIALGHHHSGLFSADDGLAEQLLAAGRSALDPCWRMPLDDEYDEALKSNFADMANVGNRAGGAITAAKFLHRFARKYPWAHLDIAGTAWKSGAAKGATGRPVPLLTHFVLAHAG